MSNVFHLEIPGAAAGDRSSGPVAAAVRAAVDRGIRRAMAASSDPPGRVDDGHRTDRSAGPGEPPAAQRSGQAAGVEIDHRDGSYRVPSYQDQGRPVALPLQGSTRAAGGATPVAPHPLVTAVNDVAARVQDAQRRPQAIVPPAGPGILGNMWARGMAADTRRLLGPTETDLHEVETRLITAVGQEGLRLARIALRANASIVARESTRYAEAPGKVNPEAVALRSAAGEMAALQKRILARLDTNGNAIMAAAGGPQAILDPDHFDDYMDGSLARNDPVISRGLLPELIALRRVYGPRYPVLLPRNTNYAELADAGAGRLAAAVHRSTSSVQRNIVDTLAGLDTDSVWSLSPVMEAARRSLGIKPGTAAAAAVDAYLSARKYNAALAGTALAALGIVLAIGATVATLGAAAPVAGLALAGDLAVAAGAGLSVYSALEQYHDYSFTHAAGHSSLDPSTALTQEDPSIAWLAVAVLGAVLDVGSAATVVRNLAGLAKLGIAAGDLGPLERAVRAQARVLAAEGRLGAVTEEEFVQAVLKPARYRLGGTAASDLQKVLTHGGYTFAINPDGPRTLNQAIEIARRHGVVIEDDVMIAVSSSVRPNEFARYGPMTQRPAAARISWRDLLGAPPKPRPGSVPTYFLDEGAPDLVMWVGLRPDVLASDEAIVAALAHEMHEINYLRSALAGDRTITMAELNRLVNGDSGSVHLQAWVVALDKVKQMRAAAAAKP